MALQLAFEDTGTGPPVVVLHGLFGSSANWRSVARALAPHHRVLCVDLRNHGQSQWADSMDYAAMADDVLPVKKMHFDGMSYREIHGLTGLSETAIFCIVNDRFEQRPDGRLRLLPNLQIPA